MLRIALTHLTAIVTIVLTIALAVDMNSLKTLGVKSLIIILAIGVTLVTAAWDFRQAQKSTPNRFKGKKREEKIREYMTNIVKNDGRCVISSNDLSWATGDARDALEEKARLKSLVLVMPKPIELSEILTKKGATAYYYGTSGLKFRSRFTLVNESRADSWVAIGYGENTAHLIREINSKDDPAFHLAEDLIELAKQSATDSQQESERETHE